MADSATNKQTFCGFIFTESWTRMFLSRPVCPWTTNHALQDSSDAPTLLGAKINRPLNSFESSGTLLLYTILNVFRLKTSLIFSPFVFLNFSLHFGGSSLVSYSVVQTPGGPSARKVVSDLSNVIISHSSLSTIGRSTLEIFNFNTRRPVLIHICFS